MRRFYGIALASPLMLGTAGYPSPAIMAEAFRRSGAAVATVSLRREAGGALGGAVSGSAAAGSLAGGSTAGGSAGSDTVGHGTAAGTASNREVSGHRSTSGGNAVAAGGAAGGTAAADTAGGTRGDYVARGTPVRAGMSGGSTSGGSASDGRASGGIAAGGMASGRTTHDEAPASTSAGGFHDLIRALGCRILPNTAGCHTVREAVTTAHMAREIFATSWIKLEVIGHTETLQPDPFALVEAARILTDDGFQVFPYTTEDLVLAERLLEAGCEVLMPWGAPIGTGLGLNNIYGLRTLRAHLPDVAMVVDAGLGLPSHAAAALEMGFDAVLLNTAVAKAGDPPAMAEAFARALEAGALARGADPMEPRDMAAPSTPVIGKAFLE